LFSACLRALAGDEHVEAVAMCVDLVHEFDQDESYPDAALEAWQATAKPFAVLSNLGSALDPHRAAWLRQRGIPVLEGTRSGLWALRNLLRYRDMADRPALEAVVVDQDRRRRWRERIAAGPLGPADSFSLLRDYGIPTVACEEATSKDQAVEAGVRIGFPVALKTATEGIAHKSDVGGVILGIGSADDLAVAYEDLRRRLGPQVTVSSSAARGVEMALGRVSDPQLGLLVVVGAGGVLVELLADRAVGLAPIDRVRARGMLDRLRMRPLLDGSRGQAAVNVASLVDCVLGVAALAGDLAGAVAALDVNPLICGPSGALAVDVLVERPADGAGGRNQWVGPSPG
jgi:acyl-CoA synthetase (NDP forming)